MPNEWYCPICNKYKTNNEMTTIFSRCYTCGTDCWCLTDDDQKAEIARLRIEGAVLKADAKLGATIRKMGELEDGMDLCHRFDIEGESRWSVYVNLTFWRGETVDEVLDIADVMMEDSNEEATNGSDES